MIRPLRLGVLLALLIPGVASATAESPAQPRGSAADCACHDALAPPGPAGQVPAPPIDLLGWAKDGPHSRKMSCLGCHPGAALQPHHPDRMRPTGCEACHPAESRDWKISVHVAHQGQKGLAGCSTCHAEHPFFRDADPRSRFANTGLIRTCVSCHPPRPMAADLVFPPQPPPPGKPRPSSYHGLIARGERRFVAACGSCHGTHAVRTPGDPTAPFAIGNREAACGNCHDLRNAGAVREKICREPRGLVARVFEEYFDLWYLWVGGTVAQWLAGVVLALAGAQLFRRCQRTSRSSRNNRPDSRSAKEDAP